MHDIEFQTITTSYLDIYLSRRPEHHENKQHLKMQK